MNIIFIKQAIKAKVNKHSLISALKLQIDKLLGEKVDNTNISVLNTSEINGVQAGGTVLLVSNNKLTKYLAISVGASTKDINLVTDDMNEHTYNFEYVMNIDKKIFKGNSINEALKDIDSNKDLSEALRIIGSVANGARYDTLTSGMYGKVDTAVDRRYSGILIVDYINDNKDEVDFEVTGRKGKTHLLRIVPVLNEEMKIVEYIDDNVMTELIALDMVDSNKGNYYNRKKLHNFKNVLPIDTLTEEDIASLDLNKDKNGNIEITKLSELEKFMELKFS